MVQLHSIREIQDDVDLAYGGHHQYDWSRPRRTWLDAACPVYIDLGDEFLARSGTCGDSDLPCVFLLLKAEFAHDVINERSAQAIATRSYPFRNPCL